MDEPGHQDAPVHVEHIACARGTPNFHCNCPYCQMRRELKAKLKERKEKQKRKTARIQQLKALNEKLAAEKDEKDTELKEKISVIKSKDDEISRLTKQLQELTKHTTVKKARSLKVEFAARVLALAERTVGELEDHDLLGHALTYGEQGTPNERVQLDSLTSRFNLRQNTQPEPASELPAASSVCPSRKRKKSCPHCGSDDHARSSHLSCPCNGGCTANCQAPAVLKQGAFGMAYNANAARSE